MTRKLNKVFAKSKRLHIDDNTKLVIMSDCHRGNGDNYDNFVQNQNIFKAALQYYYHRNFTYIELGDGDEMWEVENYKDIVETYLDIFKLLKKFNDENRLIMIYGNHDMIKKSPAVLKKYFYKYYDNETKQNKDLLEGLIVYESLVLNYHSYDIFLTHGHQVDFLNSRFWRFSRLMVRHIWKNLEHFGVKDTTNSAKNYGVTKNTDKKLQEWSVKNNKMLIAGHTHRPTFPKIGQSLYFNDGSCIHPNGITCLEIEKGKITLVKWEFKVNKEGIISVGKQVIEGNEPIINFFNKNGNRKDGK